MDHTDVCDSDEWFDDDYDIIEPEQNDDDGDNGHNMDEEPFDMLCIDNIVNDGIDDKTPMELITSQQHILYYVNALFNNCVDSGDKEIVEEIVRYLDWSCTVSKHLADSINQELPYVSMDTVINRSSYNFCDDTAQCKLFYSDEPARCKSHHYVHSLLYKDTTSLKNFFSHYITDKQKLGYEDSVNCRLSIKTLCYVSRHMANEIACIDYITKGNSAKKHCNNIVNRQKTQPSKKKIKKQEKQSNNITSSNRFSTLSIDCV